MKRIKLIYILIVSLLPINSFSQGLFKKPFLIKEGNEILNTGGIGYAAPCIGDIDGDGKDELLVGYWKDRNGGPLIIYENIGTRNKPIYKKSRVFKINNETAMIPGG